MRDPLTFRKADPVVSTSDVRAAVVATGLPKGWTWADDLGMMNRAFAGYLLTDTEAKRFKALRHAITDDGYLNLTLQFALLDAVKALAEQPAPPLRLCATTPFDDHCRTCHGSGKIREAMPGGRVATSTCHNCHGTGYGK